MSFIWKILEVTENKGVITHARYYVSTEDEAVATEGNWYFDEPENKIPYEKVTEEDVANWIQKEAVKDGKCHITENLNKQLQNLKGKSPAIAPWLPQILKIGV